MFFVAVRAILCSVQSFYFRKSRTRRSAGKAVLAGPPAKPYSPLSSICTKSNPRESRLKKLSLFLIVLFVPALLTAQIPNSNHVVVVLEENQSYPAVIGSASMPYLNSLAQQNALATQYYANVHPY